MAAMALPWIEKMMTSQTLAVFPLAAFVLAVASLDARAEPATADLVARGAYLARIMDCAGCHMPRGTDGAPIVEKGLSGGTVGFELSGLGIFWPSNLTPHETGIGGWSEAEIATALTTGVRPDGRVLVPVMPWPGYASLNKDDLDALVAWLRSVPPVENVVPGPVGPGTPAPAPFYRVTAPGN